MRIRITSDGTPFGTKVINAATGEEIEGVREVTWEWERGYPLAAVVRLVIEDVAVDLHADTTGRVAGLELR